MDYLRAGIGLDQNAAARVPPTSPLILEKVLQRPSAHARRSGERRKIVESPLRVPAAGTLGTR